MKKIILVLVFIISLISCKDEVPESKSKQFNLVVKAKNFPDSIKVYLYNRDIDKNIDSTYVVNENFEFSGHIDLPSLSYLNFVNKSGKRIAPYTFFYLENNSIKIAGDYDDFVNAEITGSRQTDLQKQYDTIVNEIIRKAKQEISKISDSLKREEAKSIFYKMIWDEQNKFLFKHANNQMPLHQILYRKKKISKDSLLLFYTSLDTKNANSIKGKELYEYATTKDIKIGDQFRNISGFDLNGKHHTLSDYVGKVILLDFWGAGCVPCRKQNKSEFQHIYTKYKNDDFVLISYSIDKKEKWWKKSSQQDNIQWVNISDLKGMKSENVKQYAIQAIPNSFLIDQKGRIVKSFIGFSEGENTIEKEIEKLLNR